MTDTTNKKVAHENDQLCYVARNSDGFVVEMCAMYAERFVAETLSKWILDGLQIDRMTVAAAADELARYYRV